MSTSIYNGYKLPMMSFVELNDFINRIREKISETAKEVFYERAAVLAVNMIDFSYILSKKEYLQNFDISEKMLNSPLYQVVWINMRDKNIKMQKDEIKDLFYDFSCKLCLIPLHDKILCLYYGRTEEFLNSFKSFKEVELYEYYDNYDKPKEISIEEWEKRRLDWRKALSGIGIPSENGFLVELNKKVPTLSLAMIDKIIERIPSFETKVKGIAMEILSLDYEETYPSSLYSDFRKWLDSKEGQEKLNKKEKEISEILPKEITNDMLKEKLKKFLDNCK